MKIVYNKKYKNKLLELQILKSKIYKNGKKTPIKNNQIKLSLKKVSSILYEYHKNNKIILFTDFPPKIEKKLSLLNKNSKHVFISKETSSNGILTNKSNNLYSQIIQQQSNTNLQFYNNKKKVDLIILFNKVNENLVNEIYNSMIPTIIITDTLLNKKNVVLNQSYKILGHLNFIEEQVNNNIFFSILHSILKQKTLKKNKIEKYKKKFQSKKYSQKKD